MPKAIVIGASSGIGAALSRILSAHGYEMGLVARRTDLLQDLQRQLVTPAIIKQIDVTQTSEGITALNALLEEMGTVDLIVVNAGVCFNNRNLEWDPEHTTIDVNVMGFAAMAFTAFQYFMRKGEGHLVGISSVSSLRGDAASPAYGASKAFVSNYLEALRFRALKENKNICVTDIRPGWVDTVMANGEQTFWLASIDKAAKQIYQAISRKKKLAYITKRWRLFAWLVKALPDWAYVKYFA